MALKLGYRDGGKTSEEGLNRITSRLLSSAGVFGDNDLKVVATGTPDNKVNVSIGDVAIGNNSPNTNDPDYYYHGWNTSSVALTVSANASGNPRVDLVVVYVDLAVVSSAANDNPGALAVKIVAGTAAASPSAPDDTAIQTSVGGTNPWLPLARVEVANGFSSITNTNITDLRGFASSIKRLADIGWPDLVASGLLWSQDTGLVGKMTTGFAVINGELVNKSFLKHTFTASKDTYVDLPITSKPTSVDDLVYTAVNNGAAAPSLAANSVRIAKVVTSGVAITSVVTSGVDSNAIAIYPSSAIPGHNHTNTAQGGQLTAGSMVTAANPETRAADGQITNYVASGAIWTADALNTTLLASMSLGVAYINGKRLTVGAVANRAFTASRDTYVDLSDNGDGTAAITYTTVTNGNVSPTLAANSIRLAKVITGASAVTSVVQSSIDSLGNNIRNTGAVAKANLEKPHFCAMYFFDNGGGSGQVFGASEVPASYEKIDPNSHGINAVVGAGAYMTITRAGLYNITHTAQCLDVTATSYIVWFEISVNSGASYMRLRQAARSVPVGESITYGIQIWLDAGTRVRISRYNGGGATRFGPGTAVGEPGLRIGDNLTLAEAR